MDFRPFEALQKVLPAMASGPNHGGGPGPCGIGLRKGPDGWRSATQCPLALKDQCTFGRHLEREASLITVLLL